MVSAWLPWFTSYLFTSLFILKFPAHYFLFYFELWLTYTIILVSDVQYDSVFIDTVKSPQSA